MANYWVSLCHFMKPSAATRTRRVKIMFAAPAPPVDRFYVEEYWIVGEGKAAIEAIALAQANTHVTAPFTCEVLGSCPAYDLNSGPSGDMGPLTPIGFYELAAVAASAYAACQATEAAVASQRMPIFCQGLITAFKSRLVSP